MSGLEIFAVVGVVAAVVSAYHDGGNIVRQIKTKRAAKRAPPPTINLETSLERGPPAVEQSRDYGIERYGPRFARGDGKYYSLLEVRPIANESLRHRNSSFADHFD